MTQLGDTPPEGTPELNLLGRRVGPYQLESELGRGGMGSVWLARRDDGYYEAKVAIKLLVTSWFGTEGAARFRQEGKLLGRLDHPNIARLLDAGITDLNEPYLVLEYVEGERIDVYCANRRLGLRERIELFLELLSAVGHAHRNLIVHRDIKPANVLVTASGQAKLLDFGIGKLVHGQDDLTSTGQRVLTPQFAAPEQLLGEPVTTATDIYGLGLMLYVLLTGQLPHAGSPAELMRRITLGDDLPAPSSIDLTRVRGAEAHAAIPPDLLPIMQRELRGDLDNIVLKALQATPTQRYEDVGAFAADLRRFLNNEPVSARPSTLSYRARKFLRRNRTGVIATVMVLLAIMAGSIATIWQTLEARQQRAKAEYQNRSTEVIADFLNLSLFSEGGPDRPALTMMERLERGVKLIESQYPNEPGIAGRMLLQIIGRMTSMDMDQTYQVIDRAYDLGRKARDNDLMAQAQCGRIVLLVITGSANGVRERLQDARQLLATAKVVDPETRVACLAAEAKIEQSASNPQAAEALLKEAVAMLEREEAASRPLYTNVLSMLSATYIDQRKFAAAVEVTLKQASIEEKFGRGDSSQHLTTLQNLAALRLMTGEVTQSMVDRTKVNQLMRKFEAELPLIYAANQAILLLRLARASEALELAGTSLERARAVNDPNALLQLLHIRAWAGLEAGDLDSADKALHEAQPLLDKRLGNPGLHSQFALRRAQLALARHDPLAARTHAEQALSLAGYQSTRPQRSLTHGLLGAAGIALQSGRTADAAGYAREALRLSESVARGVDTSADVGESLLLLAKATPEQRRSNLQRAVRCLGNGLGATHPLTVEARSLLQSDGA